MAEAMTILKAAAHTLDQQTGLSFHGPPTIAQLTLELSDSSMLASHHNADALTDFADYCLDNMEPTSSEPMVSFIKRFQKKVVRLVQQNLASMQPVQELTLCTNAASVVVRIYNLPDGIAAIKDNFVKQHVANDGPWKRDGTNHRSQNQRHNGRPSRHQDRSRVSAVQFEDQNESDEFKTYPTVVNNSVLRLYNRGISAKDLLSLRLDRCRQEPRL
jgi:hypothetical protein